MLSIRPIQNPCAQLRRFKDFDPTHATWVVSDLKSKLDLSRRLLNEREFIPGDAVLRASDLWRVLLARVRPDLQAVSREFAITLIGHELDNRGDLDWVHAPGVAEAAYGYLTQLMPILSHPEGESSMEEWFTENPESAVRWRRWFDLSLMLWKIFLRQGFIAAPWISGVLVNEPELHLFWNRPLVIDLGGELTQVEADLIANLSLYFDIEVLRPSPVWVDEYRKALVAYEVLEGKAKVKKLPATRADDGDAKEHGKVEYRKFTTMIAEVKEAVARTRMWLEDVKVALSDIAIVAPDIEVYWPALSLYLEQEGIPVQKDRVRRLHAFPDIARWFALMRLRAGSSAESDVELGIFSGGQNAARVISYERFRTLYAAIYGREDLARSDEVARRFALEIHDHEIISRDDFMAWMLRQLPGTAGDEGYEGAVFKRVDALFQRIFSECPYSLKLAPKRWLAYVERLAAKIECPVSESDPCGVSCINLGSAENSPAKRMIVMGLTEAALKRSGGTAILHADILSLASRFGFQLASEDQAKLEFEARWMMDSSRRELVLCVPETDFAGAAQAPSWLWLRGAREAGSHEKIALPAATRWDSLQKAAGLDGLGEVAVERGWCLTQTEFLARALGEDMGAVLPEAYGPHLIKGLSPSAIETYLDCPFIFAAKYLFKLSDVAALDLEVDASRRGSFMHKVFELLTREPLRFGYTPDELGGLLEEARRESGIEFADERLWPPLKERYSDLAKRFLEFEREHRSRFPESRTVAREVKVQGYLNPATGKLSANAAQGHLPFAGRIDRIDEDGRGNLAIMDYKSSKGTLSQYGSWLKNNQIQLLLYAMAVESGLTELSARPVLAALYYVARPLNREIGFKVEGAEQGLYDTGGRSQNKIDAASKQRLYTETAELVKGAVARILAGDFQPSPRERTKCDGCEWSGICRAPHLNS